MHCDPFNQMQITELIWSTGKLAQTHNFKHNGRKRNQRSGVNKCVSLGEVLQEHRLVSPPSFSKWFSLVPCIRCRAVRPSLFLQSSFAHNPVLRFESVRLQDPLLSTSFFFVAVVEVLHCLRRAQKAAESPFFLFLFSSRGRLRRRTEKKKENGEQEGEKDTQ